MRPTKDKVIGAIQSTGLVPLYYHADVEIARHALEAAYLGGVRVFEFANRGANAFEVFQELVKDSRKFHDLYLGIGTVMNAESARKFIDAGAHFVVSPIFKNEIAQVCDRERVLWIPGCATMTEIVTASDAGAEIIKIFPGSVLGPGFVSSVLPILPNLKLMPTGGVEPDEKNLSAWFKAGVFCVGMGSQLFTPDLVQSKNWKAIADKIEQTLRMIKDIRLS
ncbi:MAG: bifunctional 4-hydroxy-2-oxoglutarate aldolase/2-dehydro-3-deoxy-phosphogluconate aldolase [Bacteroidetes bacterium]|nr:bifunctional 4-hydroxy-2-oxoglutarate aldolase/2-dehydro-3-deoxy-phosphogluconate aldolase [Bacteroidota bacterium]